MASGNSGDSEQRIQRVASGLRPAYVISGKPLIKLADPNTPEESSEQGGARLRQSAQARVPPAKTSRCTVPAAGSSTRSAGVIKAAVAAAKPSAIGVENC
jgi:hypothetical protein